MIWGRGILPWACLLTLLLVFQNCTSPSSSTEESPLSSSLTSGGSGNGYDGKVFVFGRRENICPDGSVIEARIDFKGERAILVRENCADLPTDAQREVSVKIDPADPSFIVYDDVIYVAVLSQIAEFQRDSAGHLLLAGTFVPGAAPKDPKRNFAAKLDADDRLLWARELRIGGSSEITASAIGPDGSPVYAGVARDESGAPSVFVARFSSEGGRLWSRRYDLAESGLKELYASDIKQDEHGNLYVTGRFSSGRISGYLMKLSAVDGKLIWQLETRASDHLGLAPDGDLIASGLCSGLPEHCVIKVDADGGLKWSRKLGMLAATMRPLKDGSVIMAGAEGIWGPPLIAKLGADGSLLWTRTLAGTAPSGQVDSGGSLQSIEERADGRLLVAGVRVVTFSDFRGAIYSLAANGQPEWMSTHPNPFYGSMDLDRDLLRVHGYTYPVSGTVTKLSFILRLPDPPPSVETNVISKTVKAGFAMGVSPVVTSFLSSAPLAIESRDFRIKLDVRR